MKDPKMLSDYKWCDEQVTLAVGPTPKDTQTHRCWHDDGLDHAGEHKCSCGFTWSTAEVSC